MRMRCLTHMRLKEPMVTFSLTRAFDARTQKGGTIMESYANACTVKPVYSCTTVKSV